MGCESKRDKTMAKVNAIINADSPSTAPSRVNLVASAIAGAHFKPTSHLAGRQDYDEADQEPA